MPQRNASIQETIGLRASQEGWCADARHFRLRKDPWLTEKDCCAGTLVPLRQACAAPKVASVAFLGLC